MEQINSNIITQCQQGDKKAYRQLVQWYQGMVFSLALKMLGDEDEAKDITQETFIRVWTTLRKYDGSTTLSTWIYTIASRLCLDRLKKLKRQSPLPEDESVLADYISDTSPQRQLENHQWISILRFLASELSEKQRIVFTLSHLEGLSSEEIEAITGFDSRQVKSNLYVARQTIRERLKRLGYE